MAYLDSITLFSGQDKYREEAIIELLAKVSAANALQVFEPHQLVRQKLFITQPH